MLSGIRQTEKHTLYVLFLCVEPEEAGLKKERGRLPEAGVGMISQQEQSYGRRKEQALVIHGKAADYG